MNSKEQNSKKTFLSQLRPRIRPLYFCMYWRTSIFFIRGGGGMVTKNIMRSIWWKCNTLPFPVWVWTKDIYGLQHSVAYDYENTVCMHVLWLHPPLLSNEQRWAELLCPAPCFQPITSFHCGTVWQIVLYIPHQKLSFGNRTAASWACICKPFKESRNWFPAWRAGTTTLFDEPARQETLVPNRFLGIHYWAH